MRIETGPVEHLVSIEARILLDDLARGAETEALSFQLMNLMGCPFTSSGLQYSPPADQRHLDAIQEVIPKVFPAIVARLPGFCSNVSSVLAGINRQHCLRHCLETREGAYAMAVGICYYIDTCEPTGLLDQEVRTDVLALLNAWIKPVIEWRELPSAMNVAVALFGEHWCHFELVDDMDYPPGSASWSSKWILCYAIDRERPPFLAGLCPAQDEILSAPLPELGFVA